MHTALRSLATKWAIVLAAFVAFAVSGYSIIDVTAQMELGNPSGATADASNHAHYLIQRAQYALDYNDGTHQPNWVAWNLTTADIGSNGRSPSFYQDPTIAGLSGFYAVSTNDYTGVGSINFARGHMCPSADRTISAEDNKIVFYMSNIVPQAGDNNGGPWGSLENYSRSLAQSGNELLIYSGPLGFNGSYVPNGGTPALPEPAYVWKIVVVVPLGGGQAVDRINTSTRVIAVKMPNINGIASVPWTTYVTSVAQIESDTGFTFFTNLPSNVASSLRAKIDGQTTGAPTITSQPVTQTVALGGTATFTVAATSSTDTVFSYQWYKDEGTLAGATGATLTITNVQAADVGSYQVIVTNSAGSTSSSTADLIVSGLPPTIATQPAAQTVNAGTNVTFSVTAGGSAPFTYQWRKGGTPLASGGTGASLTLNDVQAVTAGSYDVVVSNSVSTVTSNAVALTVLPAAPTIATSPATQSVALGGTATFTVAATGTEPFTYQWRKGGSPLANGGIVSGATSATLTLTGIAAGDAGSYDVVVTNSVSTATSAAATLTVTSSTAGQLAYAGGTYTQNFDTLPASGTFTLSGTGPIRLDAAPISASGLAGWSLAKASGSGSVALFKIDDGSSGTGSVYSYGIAGTNAATDRALGSVASGTTVSQFGLVLVNNTGHTITGFSLGYTGEQWRRGNGAANVLAFSYAVGGSDLNTGTFTAVSALSFTAPVTAGTNVALDGNAAANRTAVSSTVTGLTWAAGQTLVLRWADTNDAANDDGIAIDDLSFSALSAPVVTTQPQALTATVGDAVTLSVAATGTPAPTYQWRKNGLPIAGNATATTAALSFASVGTADAGSYDVVVTNSAGSATSTAATLTVLTLQEQWRAAYFGTTLNSGLAADSADADGDGLANVLEYALGNNPTSPRSVALPNGTVENGQFVFRFTHALAASDVSVVVQQSTDLVTWSTLSSTVESSTGTAEVRVAALPLTNAKAFVRLNVGGVTTVPVGYINSTIAGSGATTSFSLQLDDPTAPAVGIRAGRIDSLTASTLTNASAGWSAGALADAASPWALRLTSGTAAGKVLPVTANTATALTITGDSLTALGVAVGDAFELVPVDTLNTFFGANTLTGGTGSNADVVRLMGGAAWSNYYYSTASNFWRLATGPATNLNNVPLRTTSGLQIIHRGSPLALTEIGRVLGTPFRVAIANSGNTLINPGYPTDTTLAGLAVQTRLGGWRSGTTTATADQVYLFNGTAWVGYVFNGANWQALSGGANSDAVAIPAGSAILIARPGSAAGTTDFVRPRAY